MKVIFGIIIIQSLFLFKEIVSANILFYLGSSPLGHRVGLWPFVSALAEKGHKVTFLSQFSIPASLSNPNIKEFNIQPAIEAFGPLFFSEEMKDPLKFFRELGTHQTIWDINVINSLLVCEAILKYYGNKIISVENMKQEGSIDLVVIDSTNNDCGFALAHLMKAKTVLFSPSSLFMSLPDAYGFLPETSWIPDIQRNFSLQGMSYFERIKNTLRAARWHVFREIYLIPQYKKLFQLYLKRDEEEEGTEEIFSLGDMEKSVSLILLNSYASEEFSRSMPPLVLSVGGISIKKTKNTLPKDILEFIGDKEFIYLSFGSSLTLNETLIKIVLNACTDLGLKVILKGEYNSDKVYAKNWLPQQEILGHSKIRAIITHASSFSIHEAIYFGVPIIAIPVCLDQDFNAQRVERNGIGIKLEVTQLTKFAMKDALVRVQSLGIREKLEKVRKNFKDRPEEPLELAMWWMDFILRNEDISFLKPLAIHQTWIHRRSLDVWSLIILILLTTFLVITFYFIFILKRLVATIKLLCCMYFSNEEE